MANPLLIIGLVLSAASIVYNVAQARRLRKEARRRQEEAAGIEVRVTSSAKPVPIAAGYCAAAGQLVYAQTSPRLPISPSTQNADGDERTNDSLNVAYGTLQAVRNDRRFREFLLAQYVLCASGVEGLVDLYVDEVPWDSGLPEGTVRLGNSKPPANSMAHQFIQGLAGTAALAFTDERDENSRGVGLARLDSFFRYNPDNPLFYGIPRIIGFMQGQQCRQLARTGPAVQFGNREFANDSALFLLEYMTDGTWGIGRPDGEFDLGTWHDALAFGQNIKWTPARLWNDAYPQDLNELDGTNHAKWGDYFQALGFRDIGDTGLDAWHGTAIRELERYEVNGILRRPGDKIDSILAIMATMPGAQLFRSLEGKWKLSAAPSAFSGFISHAVQGTVNEDMLHETPSKAHPNTSDRLNTLTIKFNNLLKDFAQDSVTWPPPGSTAEQTLQDEDGGLVLGDEFELELSATPYHAMDIAHTMVMTSRRPRYVFRGKPLLGIYEPGDVVKIDAPKYGFVDEFVRLSAATIRPERSGRLRGELQGIEFVPTDYAPVFSPRAQLSLVPKPDYSAPTVVDVVAEIDNKAVRQLVITWEVEADANDVGRDYLVEYAEFTEEPTEETTRNWRTITHVDEGQELRVAKTITEAGRYYIARVTPRSINDVYGEPVESEVAEAPEVKLGGGLIEYIFTSSADGEEITGAENLPDPDWDYDDFESLTTPRPRGTQNYYDGTPADLSDSRPYMHRFQRFVPAAEGIQKGADVGNIPWQQESAIRAWGREGGIIEYVFTSSEDGAEITGAENLPDPDWKYDDFADSTTAQVRGTQNYYDGTPADLTATRPFMHRFHRFIPNIGGLQKGADVGTIPWTQEMAIRAWGREGGIIEYIFTSTADGLQITGADNLPDPDWDYDAFDTPTTPRPRGEQNYYDGTPADLAPERPYMHRFHRFIPNLHGLQKNTDVGTIPWTQEASTRGWGREGSIVEYIFTSSVDGARIQGANNLPDPEWDYDDFDSLTTAKTRGEQKFYDGTPADLSDTRPYIHRFTRFIPNLHGLPPGTDVGNIPWRQEASVRAWGREGAIIEYIFTSSVKGEMITGAQNLPDPEWNYDDFASPTTARRRGTQNYYDGTPADLADGRPWIHRFRREIPASNRAVGKGSEVGPIPWEQEKAVRAWGRDGHIIEYVFTSSVRGEMITGANNLPNPDWNYDDFATPTTARRRGTQNYYDGTPADLSDQRPWVHRFRRDIDAIPETLTPGADVGTIPWKQERAVRLWGRDGKIVEFIFTSSVRGAWITGAANLPLGTWNFDDFASLTEARRRGTQNYYDGTPADLNEQRPYIHRFRRDISVGDRGVAPGDDVGNIPWTQEVSVRTWGEKGLKGIQGIRGEEGQKGAKGLKGLQGREGSKGDRGLPGEDGREGRKGDKGLAGEDGREGRKGDRGVAGEDGREGRKGDKGLPGATGLKGTKGLAGEDGREGRKGDRGLAGEDGREGSKGDKGSAGTKGQKGPGGGRGEPGDTGDTGAKGPKGFPGVKGQKGQKGVPTTTYYREIAVSRGSAATGSGLGSGWSKVGLNWEGMVLLTPSISPSGGLRARFRYRNYSLFESETGLYTVTAGSIGL